jgi:hypothetical protein
VLLLTQGTICSEGCIVQQESIPIHNVTIINMPPRPRVDPGVDEPPSKVYKFVGKPKGYKSRKLLFEALVDAKNKGKARYWPLVNVIGDDEKDAVLWECTLCGNKYSCRNPADSVGKHFVMVQGVQSCLTLQNQQEKVNANQSSVTVGTQGAFSS